MHRNSALLAVFSHCISLKNISPLKNWDVSGIARMSGLFEGCISLKNISPLKNWDVSNVVSLDYLFRDCNALMNISPLKNWDVSNVEYMRGMFDSCISLVDISSLSKWDVSNVKAMNKMFYGCSSLVDVSSLNDWKVAYGTSITSIFNNCGAIEKYPDWFKTEMIKNIEEFDNKSKLINSLDESFFKKFNLNDFDEKTQLYLVEFLTNQSILAFIGDRSEYRSVQELAVEKITDEVVLASIAIHNHNYDVLPGEGNSNYKFHFYNRENALIKIKNKVMLVKVACEVPHILDNMDHIVKFIDLEKEWADIVINAKCDDVRLFAMRHIKTDNALLRIIDKSQDKGIVKIAKVVREINASKQ